MRTLTKLKRRIHPLAPAAVCGTLAVYALVDGNLSNALAGVACIGIATTDEMTALLDQLAHAETVGEHGE
jgi:hypothetical protein